MNIAVVETGVIGHEMVLNVKPKVGVITL